MEGSKSPTSTPQPSTGRGKSYDGTRSGGRGGKSLSSTPSTASSRRSSTDGSAVKKKKKKAASRSSKSETYTNCIFKLLRQMKPGTRITQRAMSIMNSFVTDAFERIAAEAGSLCTRAKKDTLTCNEVRTAVRLVLPGDLAKHAIIEGLNAVQLFTEEEEKDKRGGSSSSKRC